MNKQSPILIVGHNDVIDQSLERGLQSRGYSRVAASARIRLNVWDQAAVEKYFKRNRPEYVFLASTKSGGIEANQRLGGEFIYSNLMSQANVIHAAYKHKIKKLLFFSSSCVYPQQCPQPMRPEHLFKGKLEPTSEPYAVAKLAGLTMCQAYQRQYGFKALVMIPATIYGPGSDADITTAHVMGALIGKFHAAVQRKAASVTVWGSGKPRREFLFADDFAAAAEFVMQKYNGPQIVNAGCEQDVSIRELAEMIAEITGFQGQILFDRRKPDGAMRKLLDSSFLKKMGWRPKVPLEEGVIKTYQWYKKKLRNRGIRI